ncbi:thiolase C-terminal domain-containing protein [Halomicrobium urmianum]|uniref:thiolase C-terminal domain-containing protein n=1 Tax=Halomicrobium urmianum TaxID=1586233 RepID=UPI001CDA3F81
MRTVALAGAAMTRFGELGEPLVGLLTDAAGDCLADAAVEPGDVDHLYVAESGGSYDSRQGLAAAVAGELGLAPAHATCVEQTSAAGAAAVYSAVRAIRAGEVDCALVVGGEKLTHASTAAATDRISAVAHPAAYRHGVTVPAFAGLTARRYLDRYDAPREALGRAGIDRDEVDLLEVHDMFTILEPLQLEALGFAERGAGWRLAVESATARDGRLPVNTSGGLKAKGHPIAASGVAQLVDLYDQLTDRAGVHASEASVGSRGDRRESLGDRQVPASTALACNVGGFGNCAVVTVLTAD